MSHTLTADLRSLILEVDWPLEEDGVTPRDDIVGMKVWMSTTDGFTPGPSNMAYDGADLKARLDCLTAGSVYYLCYALISAIDPSDWVLSAQISGTPIRVTTANQSTFIESLTADSIKAGMLRGRTFVTNGSYLSAASTLGDTTIHVADTSDFPASGMAIIIDPAGGPGGDEYISFTSKTADTLICEPPVNAHPLDAVIIPSANCVVIDTLTNELRCYGDDGTGFIRKLVALGTNDSVDPVAELGHSGSPRIALKVSAGDASAIDADSQSGSAVNARTTHGNAVSGNSVGDGVGVSCEAVGTGVPLRVVPSSGLPSAPVAGAICDYSNVLRHYSGTAWGALQKRGTQYFSEPEAANQDSISFNDTTNTFSLNADGGSGNGNLALGNVTGAVAGFTYLSCSESNGAGADMNALNALGGPFLTNASGLTNLPAGWYTETRYQGLVIPGSSYASEFLFDAGAGLPTARIAYRRFRGGSYSDWVELVKQGDTLAVASLLSTGALGYGTGAGGTVTQATSKSTAVTLNKLSGKITMNAAALAAGAAVAFTFNNSTLAATDTLTLNLLDTSVGSALSYNVWASVKAGIAIVCLLNRSAGSLSEAVAINFNVQKGVTS